MSLTNFRSILIFANCVVGTRNFTAYLSSFKILRFVTVVYIILTVFYLLNPRNIAVVIY